MCEVIRNAIRVFSDKQMNIEYLGQFLEYKTERGKIPDKYWQEFDVTPRGQRNEPAESAKRISARLSLFYEDENLRPFIHGRNEFNIPEFVDKKKIGIFNLKGFDDEIIAFIGGLVSNALNSYYLHHDTKGSKSLYFYSE